VKIDVWTGEGVLFLTFGLAIFEKWKGEVGWFFGFGGFGFGASHSSKFARFCRIDSVS